MKWSSNSNYCSLHDQLWHSKQHKIILTKHSLWSWVNVQITISVHLLTVWSKDNIYMLNLNSAIVHMINLWHPKQNKIMLTKSSLAWQHFHRVYIYYHQCFNNMTIGIWTQNMFAMICYNILSQQQANMPTCLYTYIYILYIYISIRL